MEEYALINDSLEERQGLRTSINKLSRVMIYYLLFQILFMLTNYAIFIVYLVAVQGFKTGLTSLLQMMNNGGMDWISNLTSILSITVIIFYRRKEMFTVDLKTKNHNMTLKCFLIVMCFFMTAVILQEPIVGLAEYTANIFGLSFIKAYEQYDVFSSSHKIVGACIIAPILEEIVFRGAVLRVLERYGKILAIVISSLMFSLLHMNLAQMINAFLTGLVLAYVALEYSIKWSMLLHAINNFLFCYVVELVMERYKGWLPEFIIVFSILWLL